MPPTADPRPEPALPPGLILAAPGSGHGKTTVTLALIAALSRAGYRVGSFKVGPDFIDPTFHRAAGSISSVNIDPHAHDAATQAGLLSAACCGADIVIGEGVMGLFDGPLSGGSTADLAARFALPCALVVDGQGMGASIGALASGFANYDRRIRLAGVIANGLRSTRHAELIRAGLAATAIPLLAALPHDPGLTRPRRHLGLVPASEDATAEAERFARNAAAWAATDSAAATIAAAAQRPALSLRPTHLPPPLGQDIAVAQDEAFAFAYPWLLRAWRDAGAEIRPFAPLGDAPPPPADAIFLPGGWPECHAGTLASCRNFWRGLARAGANGTLIYGECGGYMALGETLTTADGTTYPMAGLLPVASAMDCARPRLGYRFVQAKASLPGPWSGQALSAHEFHYARLLEPGSAAPEPPFRDRTTDSGYGHWQGRVFGSFLHLLGMAEAVAAP